MNNQFENYTRVIDNANDSLTEHLASWHTFALKERQLPIVSYLVTADDGASGELTSDLSKLSAEDAETVKAILAQHHGTQALEALTSMIAAAGQFKDHLTMKPAEEETNDDIPEADYPETDHDNDEFE